MFRYPLLIFLLIIFQPAEESIPWSEDFRLEWSDFKGNPNKNSDAVAITASGLTFSFSARTTKSRLIDYSAKVEAHFYPKESWCKKELVDRIVLAHEQLHFDITELHARRFRKLVSERDFSLNIKKELTELQNRINKELKVFQNKYDSESDFSRNIDTQNHWEMFVNQQLNELAEFKQN